MTDYAGLANKLREHANHVHDDTIAAWNLAQDFFDAADAIERLSASAEPTCWCVVDEDGEWEFVSGDAGSCHEHINGAINDFQIEGAEKWRVVPLYPVPAPPPSERVREVIERLNKTATCIYIAVPGEVACDIADTCKAAAALLRELGGMR